MRTKHLLSRLVSSIKVRGNHSRQLRNLRMESLEPRWVFSAAPIAPVAGPACTPVLELASGQVELVAVPPSTVGPAYPLVPDVSTQLPPAPQQLTTPVATQQAFAELAPGAEGEDIFHIEMTASYQGNYRWTFSGIVGSMVGRSGVNVVFGGLLSGISTPVNQYGQFSYTYDFGPGVSGTVTGKAVDSGTTSNIDTEFVFT